MCTPPTVRAFTCWPACPPSRSARTWLPAGPAHGCSHPATRPMHWPTMAARPHGFCACSHRAVSNAGLSGCSPNRRAWRLPPRSPSWPKPNGRPALWARLSRARRSRIHSERDGFAHSSQQHAALKGGPDMKLSVSVTNYSWAGGAAAIAQRLARLAETLDHTAVDTLWVPDHLLQADPSSSPDEPMLEAYTSLGFLAARTSRLRLGTMVSAATFREPAVLIKAVTTLDVLSGGRAWLGIGAGYNSDEASALGLFMPATGERFDRLTELLQIARRMWDGDESPFQGRYYRLKNPIARPRPLVRPPVLIGGAGERRTLRLVAEYGDACSLYDV